MGEPGATGRTHLNVIVIEVNRRNAQNMAEYGVVAPAPQIVNPVGGGEIATLARVQRGFYGNFTGGFSSPCKISGGILRKFYGRNGL